MRYLVAGLVVALAVLASASTAGATIITVDTTEDSFGAPNCSLRNAFISADDDDPVGTCARGIGDDVVKVPGGTYRLTVEGPGENKGIVGDLDVIGSGSLTIMPASPGASVTIDGMGSDRIFDHVDEDPGPLILKDIALVNGFTSGVDGVGGAIRLGSGTVRLEGVLLSGNRSTGDGGAIHVDNSAALEMLNSTVSGNHAGGSGGGIYVKSTASADLRSITVAMNRADEDGDGTGGGGGLFASGDTSMVNSILAGNLDLSPNPVDIDVDCISGPTFFPRYVISTQELAADNCLAGLDPGSLFSPTDPLIAPLADNGGPTLTHAITPGSPAIDAAGSVAPDLCPAKDQRGVPRPAGKCDLGAFEYDPNGVSPLEGPTASIGKVTVRGPAKIKKGKQATYKVAITNSGDAEATGVKLKVSGKGISSKASVGKIAAGKSRTVKVKIKPKKTGKIKATFKVTSSNAGGKSMKKTITVKK